jgi:hypothetical protein
VISRSVFSLLVLAVPGCVGLSLPPDGDGDPDARVPVASLTLSNPTPQVGEDVVLECSATGGGDGVTFAFQPSTALLQVDERRGTASFIVQVTDVGIALSVTCTATNEHGTSARSNALLITPTGGQ